MRVLVTGAGGFIGSHVARELVSGGHDVRAVIRPGGSTARLADLDGRLDIVEFDIADGEATTAQLARIWPDALVHLAWYAEPGRYLHAVEENEAALRSSTLLLRAAMDAGCRRVVLGGTCLEDSDEEPPTAYGAAKRSLHAALQDAVRDGLSGVCGHVFYLYGPLEDARRVVPAIARSLLRAEAVETTDGEQPRDYLHVADVASGFRHLVEASVVGSADICSGTAVMLREILETVAAEVGRPDLLRLGALGPTIGPGCRRAGDPSALRRLGWTPRYDVRTGIADAVAWWRLQESHT
jgi:nucleoside-diphosphate-sugar epimerase